MPAWLKMANIAWFRMALVNEPNTDKRQELEQRLAEAEAEVSSELFGETAPQA